MAVITFNSGDVLTAAQMNTAAGDSGWLSISAFTNSWTGTVRYRLIGQIVYLNGSISGGTSGLAAFTLPVGYRPAYNWNYAIGFTQSAAPASAYGSISTAGVFGMVYSSTTSGLYISTSFPIN
jgi:hypothetical protein